ncbi:MAG: hypothetical protein AB1459_17640 [Pseudomonadota bacterium]
MSERVEQLLEQLIAAQEKTNSLLMTLIQAQQLMIQALSEDEDVEPQPLLDLAGRLLT